MHDGIDAWLAAPIDPRPIHLDDRGRPYGDVDLRTRGCSGAGSAVAAPGDGGCAAPSYSNTLGQGPGLQSESVDWAAAGFMDTLLMWTMKSEVVHGNEKTIQPGVQA